MLFRSQSVKCEQEEAAHQRFGALDDTGDRLGLQRVERPERSGGEGDRIAGKQAPPSGKCATDEGEEEQGVGDVEREVEGVVAPDGFAGEGVVEREGEIGEGATRDRETVGRK